MSYCPKCGDKIQEEMSFCPKCGAALKTGTASAASTPPVRLTDEKAEKYEKREKEEKNEKGEESEKREHSFVGPLIGGLILMFLGLLFFVELTGTIESRTVWAFGFVLLGAAIILGAIYGTVVARRRHPRI